MIIAGFSGIGKSTFCRETDNAFDLECMPYKYSNLDSLLASGRSIEELKASLELDLVRGWETLYLEAVLSLHRRNPQAYIVISSISQVLSALGMAGIPYVLCYPQVDARAEYLRRYRQRGNSPEFLSIFIGRWDFWMKSLRRDKYGIHMEMNSSEYLPDLKSRLDGLPGMW